MHLSRTKAVITISIGVASLLVFSIIFYIYYYSPKEYLRSPCATYDEQRRLIMIISECTLSQVNEAIADDHILRKESSDGIWFLNSSISVSKEASLTIKAPETKWLKISSGGKSNVTADHGSSSNLKEPTPYSIQVFGKINLLGVKITSWDSRVNNYVGQKADGSIPRSYITVAGGAGTSKISNSEIAYLGFNSSRKQGLSFYGGDSSTLIGNKIHDLWYGFFSTNVGHIVLENNSLLNNKRYGIDPHLRSHDMVIKGNYVYNSRIGLICSHECSNMLYENNRIEDNMEIGIMLSRNATNSTINHNNISQSDVALAVSESHDNNIYQNFITTSKTGLSVTNNSTNNIVTNNIIVHSQECGIKVFTGAHNTTVGENYIQNFSGSGICVGRGTDQNTFYSNEIEGFGLYGINVKDQAYGNVFRDNSIYLANHAIRLYNNNETLFVNNKVGNTFGHQYIVSGNAILNLADSRFLGDTIRSAGMTTNTVNISKSGIIDVITKRPGSDTDETNRFDTDPEPYVVKLTNATLKLYSK
jgi:poly(beta-D-mannuronate) C5 epimerase